MYVPEKCTDTFRTRGRACVKGRQTPHPQHLDLVRVKEEHVDLNYEKGGERVGTCTEI